MRAVVCRELGPPEKLVVEERPDLEPGPGQVRVAVRGCGVNFVDALFIRGLYQIRPQPPFVPGTEIAGAVDAVGEGVTRLSPGDEVMAMTGLNGFADQVVVSEQAALPLPPGVDFARAAGFIQSYCTAWFALCEHACLRKGETVLVLGAAGGVGTATIEIAKALGARVIAAASNSRKLERCRERGADETICYASEDLKKRAKALSGGGVDLVCDPVGGAYAEPALRSLAPGGRYLVIGFADGEIPRLPLNLVLLKQCHVMGVNWGAWSAIHPSENAAILDRLGELTGSGRLRPAVPQTYSLESAGQALRDLMERRVLGKAVLIPS